MRAGGGRRDKGAQPARLGRAGEEGAKEGEGEEGDRELDVHDTGYERLVLSACNPLYSASQRYIVFARLVHEEARTTSG